MSNINNSLLEDLLHNGDLSASNTGDLLKVKGIENLRQAIYHRLITVKGSIVHRPSYGVGIKLYEGVLSTLEKQRELALSIKEQLELDDRIDSVDGVKFSESEENSSGSFVVKLKVTASGIGQIQEDISPFS